MDKRMFWNDELQDRVVRAAGGYVPEPRWDARGAVVVGVFVGIGLVLLMGWFG